MAPKSNKFLEDIANIANLTTMPIWEEFYNITQIPRPSKNEGKIVEYIKSKAESLGLTYDMDSAGNIVVYKPSNNGSDAVVSLQSHVDMVCEKDLSMNHNPLTDPIDAYVDCELVKARGTSLGADDGIGVATQLVIMESKDILHPNLELLFTVDEETGLNGAKDLDIKLKAKYLINLDSEDDGVITVGCASAMRYTAKLDGVFETTKDTEKKFTKLLELKASGFQGGHSGVQINETGRGNPINILAYLIGSSDSIGTSQNMILENINGGTKFNAIPRECSALISTNLSPESFEKNIDLIKKHYIGADVTIEEVNPEKFISTQKPEQLINALQQVHSGVYFLGTSKYCLVETSNNIGAITTTSDGVMIQGMLRSSNEFREKMAINMIKNVFTGNGFEFTYEGYSGWEPKDNYHLLDLARNEGIKIYGDVKVEAVHAGLECGPLNGKNPGMEIISIGPKIITPHSPSENIEISSVDKYYVHLRAILQKL